MKKKFIFTKDSSFTHKMDKMHQSVTEHIIQDDETKKLYHFVVSYGSWFEITHESVFMSHLLKTIGITGIGVGYIADDSEIDLPWYPYDGLETKSIVELPEDIKLEDVEFEGIYMEDDKCIKTFMGKKFKFKSDGRNVCLYGKDIIKIIFGCLAHGVCKFSKGKKVQPFYEILASFHDYDQDYMIETLKYDLCKYPEIYSILDKFAKLDIKKAIKVFEEETQKKYKSLCKELIERQFYVKEYLSEKEQRIEA